jgi:hypothetical protein
MRDLNGLLLLAGHGFAGTTTGASVGTGALTSYRQTHAMATTTQTANVLKSLEGHALLPAKITFQREGFSSSAQLLDISIAEIFDPNIGTDTGLGQNFLRPSQTDSVNVGQGNLDPLVAGNVNTGYPCHWLKFEGLSKVKSRLNGDERLGSKSALTLLVLGICANDHNPTVAADHTTFVAHSLD